jgi:Diguanylate cyclase, GGDEF domain
MADGIDDSKNERHGGELTSSIDDPAKEAHERESAPSSTDQPKRRDLGGLHAPRNSVLSHGLLEFLRRDGQNIRALRAREAALRKITAPSTKQATGNQSKNLGTISYYDIVPEVAAAVRHRFSLCAVMSDLDHFKRLNDAFGHSAGDIVVNKFAAILKDNCRRSNMCAHWRRRIFGCANTHRCARRCDCGRAHSRSASRTDIQIWELRYCCDREAVSAPI